MPILSRREPDNDDDPLTRALIPPSNESPGQRDARLKAEKEAQLRSNAIDEEINRQRVAEKKESYCVRVLLLGQSESGKSTTLKNFQLINSPKAFRSERASWRAVVQLNVVRSIRMILDAIAEAQEGQGFTPHSSQTSRVFSPSPYPTLSPEHLKLRMRLLPLQRVEETLLRKLSHAGSTEFEPTRLPSEHASSQNRKEFAVHSSSQWKVAFGRLLNVAQTSVDDESCVDFNDPKDPGVILNACSEDMKALWNDPIIQELLRSMRIRLEDMAGFFLDSLDRVTSLRYIPNDDDILRARLKTMGVSEHRFKLKAGNMVSHDWRIFDVGGARTLRAAWAPYFDDIDAIIFLAPISCFDQVLIEDPAVNRLEDSILLWKSIVSNPLLKRTQVILFLNKVDILKAKLKAGVRFGDFVISYGDRPNEFEHAATYLRRKFAALLKQYSPLPRSFYCHLTAVTDVKSTQRILGNVKDVVVIYQSVYRFVILSSVTDDEWVIHVGLADSQGRWWQGEWSEHDVRHILGSKSSEKTNESFAEKLREAFIRGELYIGNWKLDKGADINLTFGPGTKDAVAVPLREIEPSDAAAYATKVFLEIALQAQARGCRLHPSSYANVTAPMTAVQTKPDPVQPTSVKKDTVDVAARDGTGDKIREVRAGKPSKRSRKYAAIEFESDED
ncbi:hypothetical protein APHAL10511_000153 [Amanita phalloides]|nr:hypothetical protein APHAL10511_000153 [Amanita phalloides]